MKKKKATYPRLQPLHTTSTIVRAYRADYNKNIFDVKWLNGDWAGSRIREVFNVGR